MGGFGIATPPSPPGGGGGLPTAGMGDAMRQGMQPGNTAAATAMHPQGAMIAQAESVKKVIDQMAQGNQDFKPYADRAKAALDEGIQAVLSKPGASGGAPGGGAPGGGPAPKPAGSPGAGGSPFPG